MQSANLPVLQNARLPQGSATARVALVNMPFAMVDRPSIQCGLLKAVLRQAGHEVQVFYLNLELAAELGPAMYSVISQLRTDQFLGEWLFSVAAFGHRSDEAEYRDACPSLADTCDKLGCNYEDLCRLRNEVLPGVADRWCDEADWGGFSMIGFTSTFEQNTAAFALASRIKLRYRQAVTVFGGANFDGEMGREYLRALPFVDFVVSGEADEVLPALAGRIATGASPLGLPGVSGRNGHGLIDGGSAPIIRDLDALPPPDYDEYFETLFRLGRDRVLGDAPPLLLFETARGCWWGQKHHCTFCGLNANGMAFRSKSAARVHAELRRLASDYKIVNFEAVDNIMDHDYLDQFCAQLAEDRCDYQIFYEVKANLTPRQLKLMGRAGITAIQPGIESLSSHILTLMRKGITMLRNVRLLKWAHYYGMRVGWNLLTGFPGETESDYEEQRRVLPLLRHLPPPAGCGPVWMERFSPYFFDSSFPVRNVVPRKAYRFVYPESDLDLRKIAYFFDHEMDNTLPRGAHDDLQAIVGEWKARWERQPAPVLVYQRAPDWIQVIDRRGDDVRGHAFNGPEALIYEACSETDQTVASVQKHLADIESPAPAADVESALEQFCELGLMLHEQGHYLSLALPVNPNW
jgi:ribosomal peptide maturation radical SAM protein 1